MDSEDRTNATYELLTNAPSSQNMTAVTAVQRYVGIINGYVVPAIAILVLITNAAVVAVFKRQKTYGASQAGLVGVAVSDTLTMLFPAPFYFYKFALGYTIMCDLEEVSNWISLYLPTITHTASIWLTVILAGQRYLYVCFPFKARGWCTLRNTTIIIIGTYILAVLMHLSRFFVMHKVQNGETCQLIYKKEIDPETYLITYLILRLIFHSIRALYFSDCIQHDYAQWPSQHNEQEK